MKKKNIKILKQNGEYEFFKEEKLKDSLERSGASREMSEKVLSQIKDVLKDGMKTSEIYRKAHSILRKEQRKIAASYSLRKAVMDLGPTGFPFERFVGEVLKDRGFEVKVGKTVKGFCVSHEVDVIAYKKGELVIAETKFHNTHGIKSDLKAALYVKSRFDDIKEGKFSYKGTEFSGEKGWLITNTKFTDTAVKYGQCKGLKMIGWNYPSSGNLQDLIEESKVHPLTCLENLNNSQKKTLLKKGVVLCKKLEKETEALKSLGLKGDKINKIKEEINAVCYT